MGASPDCRGGHGLIFESFSEFLMMGGHALYVWLSYGMGLIVILFIYIQPILARKEIIKELAQRQRREAQSKMAVDTLNVLASGEPKV